MSDQDTITDVLAEQAEAIDQLRTDVEELSALMPDVGNTINRVEADAWTDFLVMLMYAPNLLLVLGLLALISVWGLGTYYVQQWISHRFRRTPPPSK